MNRRQISSVVSTDSNFSNKQFLYNCKGLVETNKRDWESNVFKRDVLAAKAGFAVEFPLLCAKLGASFIPEVLVEDEYRYVSKPTFPLLGDSLETSSSELESWMSSVQSKPTEEFIPPPDPYFTTYQSTGNSTFSLPSETECLPPSPTVIVTIDNRTHLLQSFKMRGTRADPGIIDALGLCLQFYPSFHTIEFEKCFLTAKTLDLLARYLRKSRIIQSLYIRDNPIPEQNFHTLLEENTELQHLSLQKCEITDVGAKLLASQLTYHDPEEFNCLHSLDLSSNKIGDAGLQSLADAMRTNRTLKKLILSQNNIGDVGAEALASITMKFALKSEELKFRNNRSVLRKQIREKRLTEMQMADDSSVEFFSQQKSFRARKPTKRIREHVSKDMKFDQHPYVWDARPDGPNLWCVGNISLQTLGLGHNRIGVKGVKKILDAIKYQNNLKKTEARPNIGITSVELGGNPIPPELSELNRLQEVLTIKMRENKLSLHTKSTQITLPSITPSVFKPPSKTAVDRVVTQNSPYMGYFMPDSRGKITAVDDLRGRKGAGNVRAVIVAKTDSKRRMVKKDT